MGAWASWSRALGGLIFAMSLVLSGCGKDPEADAIEEAFTKFAQAYSRRDGAAALALIDSRSVDYYARVLMHARKSTRDVLLQQPVSMIFEVLTARLNVKPEEFKGLTSEQYYQRAVTEGWWDDEYWRDVTFSRVVKAERSSARIEYAYGGRREPDHAEMSKEDGQWKINEELWARRVDRVAEQEIKKTRMTITQYVDAWLADIEGERTGKYWTPVGP